MYLLLGVWSFDCWLAKPMDGCHNFCNVAVTSELWIKIYKRTQDKASKANLWMMLEGLFSSSPTVLGYNQWVLCVMTITSASSVIVTDLGLNLQFPHIIIKMQLTMTNKSLNCSEHPEWTVEAGRLPYCCWLRKFMMEPGSIQSCF